MSEAKQWETKDSGERHTYDSGMQREPSRGKPRFDLLIPEGVPYKDQLLTRVAALMERGASEKYEPRNWEKANSKEELDRMLESTYRHFMQWFCGEGDEDHAAAIVFGVLAVETTRPKVGQLGQTDLNPLMKAVDATVRRLADITDLGAPTHTRHPDGSITEIATGEVVVPARTDFEVGDIVECVDGIPNHSGELTVGATYEVRYVTQSMVDVLTDSGVEGRYSKLRFRMHTPNNELKENPAA